MFVKYIFFINVKHKKTWNEKKKEKGKKEKWNRKIPSRKCIGREKCKNARDFARKEIKYDPPFLEIPKLQDKSCSCVVNRNSKRRRRKKKKVMDKNGKPWVEYLLDFSSWFVLLGNGKLPRQIIDSSIATYPMRILCNRGRGERENTNIVYQENRM